MPRSRGVRLLIVTVAAVAGGVLGHTVARTFVPDPGPRVWVLPYPHHVPKTPDGVSLRFAMVQDVLHERFARHGPAYYQERNRLARAELATNPSDDRRDALTDDLAAGLARLGATDEAVKLADKKLSAQKARGVSGRGLYSTYANLGTFLIYANLRAAQSGDATAKERLREGRDLVLKAIEVNPDSHFGREKWQAVMVEFLLAAIDDQMLLQTFDMTGNRLEAKVDSLKGRAIDQQRDYNSWFHGMGYSAANALKSGNLTLPNIATYRQQITHVGIEDGKFTDGVPSIHDPVPFDEPVLGIIGMWREGGGANPHFALCLGETMLRVGQRYLAWAAFERAARLADEFSTDADLQQFLRDHCRKRQETIERQLSADDVAELRPRFNAELAYGEGYQRAYQQYEAEEIDRGQSIEDEYFHQKFLAGRPPIATPVGPEDELVVTNQMAEFSSTITPGPRMGYAMLGAGVAAFAMAMWMRRSR